MSENKKLVPKSVVFLDRDGTIIKDVGYLSKTSQIEFLDDAIEGLRKMQNLGFELIIVTNQSGIARGYFSVEDYEETNKYLCDILSKEGIEIAHSYYCPHHKDGIVKEYSIECNCRKPKTGMIDQACKEELIDLESSYVIGDKTSDIELGKNIGSNTILIQSSLYDIEEAQPDHRVENLLEAANCLVDARKGRENYVKRNV